MEELRKLMIETNVDKLLELVDSRGKITAEECSTLLDVPESIIEEWSEVLSKHNLLEIDYRMKYTILKSKSLSRKEGAKAIKGLRKENLKVIREGKKIARRIRRLERELRRSDRLMKSVDKRVDRRLVIIEKKSRRIGASEKAGVEKEVGDIKRIEEELTKRIGGLRDSITGLAGGKIAPERALKEIMEIEGRIKSMRDNAVSLGKIARVLEKKVRKIKPAKIESVKRHLFRIGRKPEEKQKKDGVKKKFFIFKRVDKK